MAELETIRTEANVDKILKFAKLNRSDFKPTVQCISFDTALDNECVQLLEVDQTILKDIKQGQTVCFRGQKDDSATLCTSSKTYDVKMKETSNTLLLLPDLKLSDHMPSDGATQILRPEVKAVQSTYLEVKTTRPRLKRLQLLLGENTYNGWEYEEDEFHQGKKYTFAELLDEIQASEEELLRELKKLHCCEIKDYWRMLNFDFLVRVVEEILKLVEQQSWTIDLVPENECCDILQELYPRNVVSHVLSAYADNVTNDDNESIGMCRLNEDRICRMFAEIIAKASERFHLENFLSIWQQSVPDGMSTALYQLEGLGLVDRDSTPSVFRYFPVSNLPEDAEELFNVLFREKAKWTLGEITPYVKHMATDKLTVGSLLMRHARGSTENGIKVYSSKRPVTYN